MTSPTTILDIEADAAVSTRRRRAGLPWSLPFARRQRTAERDAEWCLALFIAAALRPGVPGSESLAATLFARGAVDAAADRAALGGAARARLERALHRAVAGSRGRATAGWRRTLSELGQTQRGRVIRRCGEEALYAWLRGDPPAPRLAALLRSQRADPRPAPSLSAADRR
jgi:hypothetical protein